MSSIPLMSRYGAVHHLEPVPELGNKTYRYVPAEEWMPMYYAYDTWDNDADENELASADTDGGPFLTLGSKINDRVVKRLYWKKDYGTLIEFE